jgi:hypothetical protein
MRLLLHFIVSNFIVLSFSQVSFALPFHKTPTSYQYWLNQQKWENGDKLIFLKLDKCIYLNPDYLLEQYRKRGVNLTFNEQVYMEEYYCGNGFVEIINPQGKKICIITKAQFSQLVNLSSPPHLRANPKINISYDNCRWI